MLLLSATRFRLSWAPDTGDPSALVSKADLRFFELTSPVLLTVVDSPNAAIALAAAAEIGR